MSEPTSTPAAEAVRDPREAVEAKREKADRWRARLLRVVDDMATRLPDLTAEQLTIIAEMITEAIEPLANEAKA